MAETIDFSKRNTPEGMPGVLLEYAEDGTVNRIPVVSRSLREVFSIPSPATELAELDQEMDRQ